MNGRINSIETAATRRFNLQTLFVLVTFFAIYFSAATIMGLGNIAIIAIGLIIAIRIPVVYLARKFELTIPLLLIQFAIPVLLCWPSVAHELACTKSGVTTAPGWIGYSVIYLATPLFMFLVDVHENYASRYQKILRLFVEVVFLIVWGGITSLILIDMIDK